MGTKQIRISDRRKSEKSREKANMIKFQSKSTKQDRIAVFEILHNSTKWLKINQLFRNQ
jgi:hypothetical protein